MAKRVAIIGTAGSWVDTPWNDPSLECWSLNDGYMCRDAKGLGFQRISRWYELHPLDKMWFRPRDAKVVYANQVPKGAYVRPEGHLEWLKTQAQTIPVYLQGEPPAGWPVNAKRFPIEEIESRFGKYWGDQPYWASGPSYMVAQAILEGATEIAVYGIHLSTQAEYLEQRPNFEHILGIAKGLGVKVTMAKSSPLLKHPWKYGYEPKPIQVVPPQIESARKELQQVRQERSTLSQQLVTWPRFKSKAPQLKRLRDLDLLETDLAQTISRFHAESGVIAIGGPAHA